MYIQYTYNGHDIAYDCILEIVFQAKSLPTLTLKRAAEAMKVNRRVTHLALRSMPGSHAEKIEVGAS